jgi:hypothetical protein
MEKIIKEYVNEVSTKSRIEYTQNGKQKEINLLTDHENISLRTVNNYQDAKAYADLYNQKVRVINNKTDKQIYDKAQLEMDL